MTDEAAQYELHVRVSETHTVTLAGLMTNPTGSDGQPIPIRALLDRLVIEAQTQSMVNLKFGFTFANVEGSVE